jgi:hypothetical protein
MDIRKLITELREERACLDQALLSLERLSLKRGPRRGRPPSWMKATLHTPPTKKMAQTAI